MAPLRHQRHHLSFFLAKWGFSTFGVFFRNGGAEISEEDPKSAKTPILHTTCVDSGVGKKIMCHPQGIQQDYNLFYGSIIFRLLVEY